MMCDALGFCNAKPSPSMVLTLYDRKESHENYSTVCDNSILRNDINIYAKFSTSRLKTMLNWQLAAYEMDSNIFFKSIYVP